MYKKQIQPVVYPETKMFSLIKAIMMTNNCLRQKNTLRQIIEPLHKKTNAELKTMRQHFKVMIKCGTMMLAICKHRSET